MFLILLIKLVSADMKSCSEKHDKLEVCIEGKEGYKIPFPVLIGSDLYLLEIIDIDELVGCTFDMPSQDGKICKATITNAFNDFEKSKASFHIRCQGGKLFVDETFSGSLR